MKKFLLWLNSYLSIHGFILIHDFILHYTKESNRIGIIFILGVIHFAVISCIPVLIFYVLDKIKRNKINWWIAFFIPYLFFLCLSLIATKNRDAVLIFLDILTYFSPWFMLVMLNINLLLERFFSLPCRAIKRQ